MITKKHNAVAAMLAALFMIIALAACDGAKADPPKTASPSPSTAATPHADPQDLKAAQQAYVTYYTALIDAERKQPTGQPPEALLKMTVPDGPEQDWLTGAFAQAKKVGGRIVGGDVKVTTGPEVDHDMWRREVIKFRACHDARAVKAEVGGKPVSNTPWELVAVEMRAAESLDDSSQYGKPGVWKVYSKDQVSKGKSCAFD